MHVFTCIHNETSANSSTPGKHTEPRHLRPPAPLSKITRTRGCMSRPEVVMTGLIPLSVSSHNSAKQNAHILNDLIILSVSFILQQSVQHPIKRSAHIREGQIMTVLSVMIMTAHDRSWQSGCRQDPRPGPGSWPRVSCCPPSPRVTRTGAETSPGSWWPPLTTTGTGSHWRPGVWTGTRRVPTTFRGRIPTHFTMTTLSQWGIWW